MASTLDLDTAVEFLRGINLSLRPHQIEGIKTLLKWYHSGHGGILADEMGLGKTCEAVVALSILCSHSASAHGLIICPLSTIDHWENELNRFSCNRLHVFRYYGSKEKREELQKTLHSKPWNVLLTTFEMYLKDVNILPHGWEFAVFDEAHRVKNELSLMHRAILQSNIGWLLLMTGTPIQNRLDELYSLLELISPNSFPPDGMANFVKKYKATKDQNVRDEFHTLFGKFCIRRTKAILSDVPSCSEVVLHHGLTKLQYELYKAVLTNNREIFLRNNPQDLKNIRQSLMSVLIQLRKVCNHPYLFKGIEKEPFIEGEHIFTASGKLLILDRLLKYLFEKGHKVLIFSQMTRFLDIVNDCLTLRGYTFETLDGRTKSEDRLRAIENFQRPNSNVQCFLLSTKAGGFGLNLTAADTVVFLDWDFNPQNDLQAAARCHRIGQSKPVKVIRLIAKHTVEELIKYRASKKLKLAEFALGEKIQEGLITETEFSNLLIHGLAKLEVDAYDESSNAFSEISDELLEQNIGETSKKGFWTELKSTVETESLFDENQNDAPLQSIYEFEGKDYSENRKVLDRIWELAETNENMNLITRKGAVEYGAVRPTRIIHPPKPTLTPEQQEERRLKRKEAERERREKRAQEKLQQRLTLWSENKYTSMNLELPLQERDKQSIQSSVGRIYGVLGDVMQPHRALNDRSKSALILQCVDDGGHYGTGGLFSSIKNVYPMIAYVYENISNMDDLNMGDSHLVANIFEQQSTSRDFSGNDEIDQFDEIRRTISLVLMVVQSVYDRYLRTLSKNSLEKCLKRVRNYAIENDARSVHLPMIWFGVRNLDEMQIRSMLTNHLCAYGISVYIYKYRRGGRHQPDAKRPRLQNKEINETNANADVTASTSNSTSNLVRIPGKARKSLSQQTLMEQGEVPVKTESEESDHSYEPDDISENDDSDEVYEDEDESDLESKRTGKRHER